MIFVKLSGCIIKKEFLGTYDVEQGASGRQWIRLALVPEQGGQRV